MNELITLAIHDKVATLSLNQPERHNALSGPLVQAFSKTLKQIQADANIHAVILRGNGKHFCAGADIKWMQALSEASFEENKQDALVLAELFYDLYHLTKPTVALVQGAALGGALGVIACCDLVIAQPQSHFGFSEVKLGIAPAVISPYVVAAMGVRQARRYFLTGEKFSAQVALETGLVHLLADDLDEAAAPYIELFLQNSPQAMAVTKGLTTLVSSQTMDAKLAEKTAEVNARMRKSEDGQEGLKAFIEKRKPVWQL